MDSNKTIVGKCPQCGGDVVKTFKGYACENSLSQEPKCNFFLFSTVGNRRLSDAEAAELLDKKRLLLDGFSSKEGKTFTSILSFNQDGTVNMSSQFGICPKCNGILYVNSRAVSCSNYRDTQNPCNFTLWRNIEGHELSLTEMEEIINLGGTMDAVKVYDTKGISSLHKLSLDADKKVVKV